MKPLKKLNEIPAICTLIQLHALVALLQLSTAYTNPISSLPSSWKVSQQTLNDPDSRKIVITKKDMFEQKSPIHEAAGMEDPMITSRDPKWWDSCNAKRNETIISLTSDSIRFPKREYADDYQGKDRFFRAIRMLNASLNAEFIPGDLELSRRKRSIITFNENIVRTGSGGGENKNRNLLVGKSLSASNSIDYDRSAFVLKKPNKINSYGLKKTSFSMNSNAKLMELAKRSKKRYYLAEQGSGNVPMVKSEFHPAATWSPLTMPTTQTTIDKKENATQASLKGSKIQRELQATADRLISRALFNDIRATWHISCGLNAVRNLQQLSNAINQTLGTEMLRVKASQDLIKANMENQRAWLPAIDDLRRDPGPKKPLQATGVLTNISHYTQLFGVAIEQMIFDQVTLDQKYVAEYREVERLILKIICDIETIAMYLERLRASRQELFDFLRAANMSIDDPTLARLHLPELASSAAYRSKYKLDTLDSPLLRFPKPNEAALPDSNGQVTLFASRDRMPQAQRKLGSPTERLIRDQAIVNDLAYMVRYYESTLMQIYVNKDK